VSASVRALESACVRLIPAASLSLLVLFAGCVNVSVEPISAPTAPGPGWKVYTMTSARLSIALPDGWDAIELAANPSPSPLNPRVDPALATQLSPVLSDLKQRGARMFAYDPATPVAQVNPRPFPAMLYVNPAMRTEQSLDAIAASFPAESSGRTLVDMRRSAGVSGDRLIRRVRETRVRPDHTLEITIQYFVVTIHGGFAHGLVMQIPEEDQGLYEATLDNIAGSFAPF
jgi:hypothetical protein